MEPKLVLPLSLLVVNVVFCVRYRTWSTLRKLSPVATAKAYLAARRGSKALAAYRAAGLLVLILAASIAHGQTPCLKPNGVLDRQCEARRILAETRIYQRTTGVYSDGDDVLMQKYQHDDDMFGPSTTGSPALDATLRFIWNRAGSLFVFGLMCVALAYLARKSEHDATNVDVHNDYYARVVEGDYHGDDAFEVPDGMHSEHMPVPVRSRSAAAGR